MLLAVFFASLLMTGAAAEGLEETVGLEALTRELPAEAGQLLKGIAPDAVPDAAAAESVAGRAAELLASLLPAAAETAGKLLVLSLIISAGTSLDASGRAGRYIFFAGAAAIGAEALGSFQEYLHMGVSSLESLADYSHVLLPALSAVAAAGGAMTSAAGKYAATVLAMDALITLSQSVICPLISACAVLSLAGAAFRTNALQSGAKLCRWICGIALSLMALGFTAWISLTGIVAGTADALTARAAKTAVSAALPVVGGIVADASGALAAAALTLRNSVGVFGMLAVLGITVGPFFSLLVRFLLFKLTAALTGCVADGRLAALIGQLGSCFGLILALNGTGALMLFVSVYSLLQTVT